MNKEQQLREAIIKTCPDIMELRYNCRVKATNHGDAILTIGADYPLDENKKYLYVSGGRQELESKRTPIKPIPTNKRLSI